jgi:hypothetical protein
MRGGSLLPLQSPTPELSQPPNANKARLTARPRADNLNRNNFRNPKRIL